MLENVGWACCEVTHMSLALELTCSRSRRDRLNNLRSSFTYIAQFSVFLVAGFYFWLIKDPVR